MAQLDIKTIFSRLDRHRVQYVLVGAMGAIAHGARLRTADVDICNATDAANLQRIAAALQELDAKLVHAPARDIDLNDWTTLRLDDPTEHHLFSTSFGELDIVPQPLGMGGWGTHTDYTELSSTAVTVTAFGLLIHVAAFAEIAASKTAARRAQDLAAEAELQRVGDVLARGERPDYGLEQFAAEMKRDCGTSELLLIVSQLYHTGGA